MVGDDKIIVFLQVSYTGRPVAGTWEGLDWWTELCFTSAAINESRKAALFLHSCTQRLTSPDRSGLHFNPASVPDELIPSVGPERSFCKGKVQLQKCGCCTDLWKYMFKNLS